MKTQITKNEAFMFASKELAKLPHRIEALELYISEWIKSESGVSYKFKVLLDNVDNDLEPKEFTITVNNYVDEKVFVSIKDIRYTDYNVRNGCFNAVTVDRHVCEGAFDELWFF